LIATIKPRDLPGKTRRRLAVELIAELQSIDRKITALKKELTQLVTGRGSTMLELTVIGPSSAAGYPSTSVTFAVSPTGTASPGTAPHPQDHARPRRRRASIETSNDRA
jgi:hypothetical protein